MSDGGGRAGKVPASARPDSDRPDSDRRASDAQAADTRVSDARRRALRERLRALRLMVLVGTPDPPERALAIARAALAAGPCVIQLRLKHGSSVERARAAEALLPDIEAAGALLLIDDDAPAARAAGVHGVHIGQQDAPPAAARSAAGAGALVGLSVHDRAEAEAARPHAAACVLDYLGVGTIYASPTKPDLAARGPAVIAEVREALPGLPIFAIGGITADLVGACLAAGAHGVAVSSAITRAASPTAAARAFLDRLR